NANAVGAKAGSVDVVQLFGDLEIGSDGVVAQIVKLSEDGILIAKTGKSLCQQVRGFGSQEFAGGASAVYFAQVQVESQRPFRSVFPRTCKQTFHKLVGRVPVLRAPAPITTASGVAFAAKHRLPDFKIARDVRLACGVDGKARNQEHQVRLRAKYRPGGAGRKILSTE